MSQGNKIIMCLGIVSAVVVGFIVLPRLIKILRGKIYKSSLKTDEIDFDNMGPEIVKRTDKEEE